MGQKCLTILFSQEASFCLFCFPRLDMFKMITNSRQSIIIHSLETRAPAKILKHLGWVPTLKCCRPNCCVELTLAINNIGANFKRDFKWSEPLFSVWPDSFILFQNLAIYNTCNLPNFAKSGHTAVFHVMSFALLLTLSLQK